MMTSYERQRNVRIGQMCCESGLTASAHSRAGRRISAVKFNPLPERASAATLQVSVAPVGGDDGDLDGTAPLGCSKNACMFRMPTSAAVVSP